MKKLLILLLIILNFKDFHCGELKYERPISFESVISSFPYDQKKTIPWEDGNVVFGQPGHQIKPTILIGSNIPMGNDYFNDQTLINFFGNNTSEANLISHFNCKNSGEPSCQEYEFSGSQKNFCLLMASIDGFDYVTIETNTGTLWNKTASGSFSTNFQECNDIEIHQTTDKLSLGCFEEQCTNPNYLILQSLKEFTKLKICYSSFSTSANILYSFDRCYDPTSEIVTLPPKISAFSVSGFAFLDGNSDGIYQYGVDSPYEGVPISITSSLGQPARDLNGNVISGIKTNKQGYYSIQGLSKSSYIINFGFDASRYASTTKFSDLTNTTTSKINPNFSTSPFILSSSAPGVVDSTSNLIQTDKELPGINGGIILK